MTSNNGRDVSRVGLLLSDFEEADHSPTVVIDLGDITPPTSIQFETTLLLESVALRLEKESHCERNWNNQNAHNCRLPPPSPDPEETSAKRLKSISSELLIVEQHLLTQTPVVNPPVVLPLTVSSEQRINKYFNQMLLKRLLNLNDNFVDSIFFDEVFTSFMKGSYLFDLVSDCVAEIQA